VEVDALLTRQPSTSQETQHVSFSPD